MDFEAVCFKAGNEIFITHCYKYDASEQAELWEKAGLMELDHWVTEDGYYGRFSIVTLSLLVRFASNGRTGLHTLLTKKS